MSRLIVRGGAPLHGEMTVGGAKNAVLPILACSLLSEKPVLIKNFPRILDAFNMVKILETLGCTCETDGDAVLIDPRSAECHVMPQDISGRIRSSIFMLGPILGRFSRAECSYPGGCEIGQRPIDLHLSGLSKLNVKVEETGGTIYCSGYELRGADVHLDYPSVGATENIMMAAAGARGRTRITNAAREPEIEDLEKFLRAIGVNVYGAGTTTVTVDGRLPVDAELIEYEIMPDRIVAGTMLCAAAITGGSVRLGGVRAEHMQSVIEKLRETGCTIDINEDSVSLKAPARLREIRSVETLPHPGFPTDMQPQLCALCTIASGTSVITENVFENRFKHLSELARMGAEAVQKDRTAIIRGTRRLHGAQVTAHDLRGGAALTLAGLAAEGRTFVENAEYIDRGYESIDKMLNGLGADIVRDE